MAPIVSVGVPIIIIIIIIIIPLWKSMAAHRTACWKVMKFTHQADSLSVGVGLVCLMCSTRRLLSALTLKEECLIQHAKGLLHPKIYILSFFTYPLCRSEPIKALFVFRTQFKIFGIKTRRLVTVPLTAK